MKISIEDLTNRIEKSLSLAAEYGLEDGSHHKMWVIDQIVRALTGSPIIKTQFVDFTGETRETESFGESEEYLSFVAQTEDWDVGSAP